MTPSPPKRARLIRVQSWHDLSPNLRRIVFHSPELADYPFECNGAHIKIFLPQPGQSEPVMPEITPHGPRWPNKASAPYKRSYTLSAYDREACTLAIDFVLHGDNGPASAFAEQVQSGQTIGVSPPAGKRGLLEAAPCCLLAGDLSALPAITAMLADMAADTQGCVLLWLPESADLPASLPKPAGVEIKLFTDADADPMGKLVRSAEAWQPCGSDARVWFAGEAEMVAALRPIARVKWQLPAGQCYAVPFWRRGEDEEQYHRQRHDFMDSDA
ncbi:siderophore-interacting protein [Uruburuella testudinis]|uniref:Siderophore-interacting protein n=1 Tax=Uruburuella testudinis TaxID=1282863 RepID=A0ABY4DRP4_9NEIS|nr:siderophore-interacting protein [Uruburuella testudinis]UOO81685.1 siderophore-interacting protein [Uruburuella testudinis]